MPQRYRTLADYFNQTGDTKEAIAEKLDISRSYVSLIASGDRQPALRLALRIAKLTGVPVESLVKARSSAA